jgi:hypothetical protein
VGKIILVVDDERKIRLILTQILSDEGYCVRVVENGEEAVALCESWHPHLILMDMRMPVMDGYEATRRIKAGAEGQDSHERDPGRNHVRVPREELIGERGSLKMGVHERFDEQVGDREQGGNPHDEADDAGALFLRSRRRALFIRKRHHAPQDYGIGNDL